MPTSANPAFAGEGVAVDVIGRGLSFPMKVDHTGSMSFVSGPDAIDKGMTITLSTAPGERVMRPEFGCAVWDLVFAPVNDNTLGLMAHYVREALARWEPRAEVDDVVVAPDSNDPSLVIIEISYRVRATNDLRNLVYPFYVIPETNP